MGGVYMKPEPLFVTKIGACGEWVNGSTGGRSGCCDEGNGPKPFLLCLLQRSKEGVGVKSAFRTGNRDFDNMVAADAEHRRRFRNGVVRVLGAQNAKRHFLGHAFRAGRSAIGIAGLEECRQVCRCPAGCKGAPRRIREPRFFGKELDKFLL